MNGKASVFARIKQFFWPARETYDTRQARGGEPGEGLSTQYYQGTDRRRNGGSADIGGV